MPVGNARYATARAVAYAGSLHAVGVEALFLVTDNSEISAGGRGMDRAAASRCRS